MVEEQIAARPRDLHAAVKVRGTQPFPMNSSSRLSDRLGLAYHI